MAINVGINGYGRIGRVALRIMSEQPENFNICAINLRKADLGHMVYLTKYDSVFRQFKVQRTFLTAKLGLRHKDDIL